MNIFILSLVVITSMTLSFVRPTFACDMTLKGASSKSETKNKKSAKSVPPAQLQKADAKASIPIANRDRKNSSEDQI
ncbi:MAG: hypothetical protein AABZ55_11445 [Bdellovibrionota bacterium]